MAIEIAADELTASWLRRDSQAASPAESLAATVARLMTKASAKVRQRVEQTRSQLAELQEAASRAFPSSRSALAELPKPPGLPIPDPSALAGKVALRRPTMLSLLGKAVLRRHVRTKLWAQVGSELHDFQGAYSRRVTEWAKRSFAELEAAFTANAGIISTQLALHQPTAPEEASHEGLQKDILLLERWGEPEESPRTRTV